jgi:hypothetical protein
MERPIRITANTSEDKTRFTLVIESDEPLTVEQIMEGFGQWIVQLPEVRDEKSDQP